jgi:hypothetical protein
MRDVVEFSAPLGLLGTVAERLVLARHVRSLIELRNRAISESLTDR